jgi:hypothetical protein
VTVARAVAVAAVRDAGVVGSLVDLRLAGVGGSTLVVAIGILLSVDILVLGPLIVVSADLAGILLIVVLVGVDEVVGLAPPGVEVRAVGLLGVLVVVVARDGSLATGRGIVVVGTSAAIAVRGVALAPAAVAALATAAIAVVVIVTSGRSSAVRGGAIDVLVDAPGLSTPLVGVLVVPLIVGLGIVGLSPGLLVRLIDLEVLVAAPGIPVGAGLAVGASGTVLGGSVVLAAATLAIAAVAAVAALAVGALPGRGSSAVLLGITVSVHVAVLSPLVVIGLEPPSVAGAIIRASLHGIVRLAPPGVGIGAVCLLGPGIVVVLTLSSLVAARGTLPVRAAVAALAGAGAVAVLAGGGLATVGGGTDHVAVLAPSLGAPLVGILVVPLIVRLSSVALSAGVVERDLLMEVLIAAISVPVGAGTTPVGGGLTVGGVLVVATLAPAAVAALGISGSSRAVLVVVALSIGVAVLSPLVVVGDDLTGVVLVVVGLGLDGIVRLAPPGVVVSASSLLGPLIVVVGRLLGSTLPGGTSSLLASLSGAMVGLAVRAVAVALGTVAAPAALATVRVAVAVGAVRVATIGLTLGGVVISGGIILLRGHAISIAVLAPSLSTVGVVVLVVPLVVGLSAVGLGAGVAVGLVNGEVLVAAPRIPVGGGGLHVVVAIGLGGVVGRSSALDDLGAGHVVNLSVAAVAT